MAEGHTRIDMQVVDAPDNAAGYGSRGRRRKGVVKVRRQTRRNLTLRFDSPERMLKRWHLQPGELLVLLMVFLVFTLGGGGTSGPHTEMPLQIALAGLVALPLAIPALGRGLGKVPVWATILAVLVIALPAVQLVPLPPAVWQALPGRDVEAATLALVGADRWWMPLSMAPAQTMASLLATVAVVLVMIQVARLGAHARTLVGVVIVLVCALSLVLGALQMAHLGGMGWTLYSEYHRGWVIGFFANRNATTDFLQIGMLALGMVAVARVGDGRRHAETLPMTLVGFVVLSIACVLTGSRAGIALYPLTVIFMAVMLWREIRRKIPRIGLFVWAGSVVAVLAAAGLSQIEAVQRVIARFDFAKESRWDVWTDTYYAAARVWPYGSGVGTFTSVMPQAERLEVVDITRPVRAHNDWLEWVLEGGLPGQILLGLVALVMIALAVRAIREAWGETGTRERRAQVLFANAALLHIGLHAIFDYPLRTMALAAILAISAAFLMPLPTMLRDGSAKN